MSEIEIRSPEFEDLPFPTTEQWPGAGVLFWKLINQNEMAGQSTDRRLEFHRVVANAVTAMRNIPKLYNFRSTSTFNPHRTSSPHTSPVDFSKCALHGFPDRSRLVNTEVRTQEQVPEPKNSVYFYIVSFRQCLLGSEAPEKKGHILKSVIGMDWNI